MNSNPHRSEETARRGLLAHPLFPAIGALWIATGLALGAMVVPAGLIERAVAAVHLDELVPAARPPLGFTARMLLGFVLALGGGGAGWFAAVGLHRRALAAPAATAVRPARPEPAMDAPAAAPADDEGEDLARLAAARPAPVQRRRGLTSETAEAPSILEISAIPALEPLTAEPSAPPPAAVSAPASPAPAHFAPAQGPSERIIRFRSLAELGGEAAARLCAAPLEALGVVQLAERFALALAARRLRDRSTRDPQDDRTAPFAEPRGPGEPRVHSGLARPFDMPADKPGRPTLDPAAELARWTLPEPDGAAEDAEELAPDPAAVPVYSSLTEMRPAARVPAPLADFVRIEDDGETSLAEAGPQPVVVFPGQAVPAPPLPTRLPGIDEPAGGQQTEAALREALAALRRMSGAG